MAQKLFSIYRILNRFNSKCYVGLTVNTKGRKSYHFGTLKLGKHTNSYLQHAYDKYGREAFDFEILESGISEDQVKERERYWIKFFKSYRGGYNLTPGGDDRIDIGKPCAWNGVEYPSISIAARALGVGVSTMRNRLSKGWSCDTDIPKRSESSRLRRHSVSYNGTHYRSIKEAAEANGIHPAIMSYRIGRGMQSDNDIPASHQIDCEWNGIRYSSIAEAARALNISSTTLRARIRKGYKSDNDLSAKNNPHVEEAIIYNGFEYPNIAEAARANGIKYATLRRRLRYRPKIRTNSGQKECEWNGIVYPSITAAALSNGIGTGAMSERLQLGYKCDDDLQGNRKKTKKGK